MSAKNNVVSMVGKVKMVMADSLQNLLTGLGVLGQDKSAASTFVDIRLDETQMEDAYSSDWLVQKVCNLPPFDMTREWRRMTGDMSSEDLEKWEENESALEVLSKIKEAMTWGRVYGGAGIVINVNDGVNPREPLELDRIKQGSLKFLIVSDRQFLHMGSIDNDPMSKNYGYPETYRLAPSSVEIHHSRVIRFEGVPLPLQARRKNKYWSKSVIEALHSALLRAAEVQESIGTLIHEATVDVIRIPDLMEMITDEQTAKELQTRFAVAKQQKSINRVLLMDKEEEYEQHNQTFAGLTDMIEKFLSIVAGAADIPITRLLGQSPAGMNATGESDLRNYYDHLSAKQEVELRPKLAYLDQIMFRSLFGREPKSDELTFEFDPLWQMSEQEKAELESSRASRDIEYLNNNIVNEAIIARDLQERGTYSGVDAKYVKEMEKMIEESEEELDKDEEGEDELDENDDSRKPEQEEENADKE